MLQKYLSWDICKNAVLFPILFVSYKIYKKSFEYGNSIERIYFKEVFHLWYKIVFPDPSEIETIMLNEDLIPQFTAGERKEQTIWL